MENVILSTEQLDAIGGEDCELKNYFLGTFPCDKLPTKPQRQSPQAHIVNTDPDGMPERHWLGIWTENNACELLGSYALPIATYETMKPLEKWMKHWHSVIKNKKSLQSLASTTCGDYAMLYIPYKVSRHTMEEFLDMFSDH